VVEHPPAPAGLHDDDRDGVRDHVVELASDTPPLLQDRRLGLGLLLLEPVLALAPQTDRETGEPGTADDERAEGHVPDVKPIAVVADERRDQDGNADHAGEPGPAAAGIGAQRIQPEDDDDAEERGVPVEVGRDELEDPEPRPDRGE
jgi:hypothetical protein